MKKGAGALAGYRYGEGCKGPGLWLGVTRYTPRGVRKGEYVRGGYFQQRLPLLSPSPELVHAYLKKGMSFARFARKYRSEMARPEARQMIDLLALAARQLPVHVGCFCEDESRCHRSVLLELIEATAAEQGGGRPLPSLGKFASPACSMPEIAD